MANRLTPILLGIYLSSFFLILTSCGGGGGGGLSNATGDSDIVSAVIGPAGGSLTTKDGNATITIPPGALTTNTTITAAPVENTPVVLSASVAGSGGSLYEFGPVDTVFNSDVTISFNYDPADLPAGVQKAGLRIAMTGTEFWQLADSESNDPANNTVSGTFSQAGTVGVVYVITAQLDSAQVAAATATTVDSHAQGSARLIIDSATNTLQYELNFTGLSGDETTAHIHGPAARGVPGDVLFDITSGDLSIGLIDYDESEEADLLMGLDYIDVHSTAYPDGELRGQIDNHQIVSPDGLLTLDIPVGELPPGVDITIRKLDTSEIPAELSALDPPAQFAYEFGPDGLTFNEPITVEVKLDDIDTVDSDIDTGLFVLVTSSGGKVEALATQGTNVDLSRKQRKVVGKLEHFSTLVGTLAKGITATITGVPQITDTGVTSQINVKVASTDGSILVTSSQVSYKDGGYNFHRLDSNGDSAAFDSINIGLLAPGNSQVSETVDYKCGESGAARFVGRISLILGGVGILQTLDKETANYTITGSQSLICRGSNSSIAQGTATTVLPELVKDTPQTQIKFSIDPVKLTETVGNTFIIEFSELVSNLPFIEDTRFDLDFKLFDINPGVISKTPTLKNSTGTPYIRILKDKDIGLENLPHVAVNEITNGAHTQALQYSCLKAGDTVLAIKSYVKYVQVLPSNIGPEDFLDLGKYVKKLKEEEFAAVIHCTAPSTTGGDTGGNTGGDTGGNTGGGTGGNTTTETGFVNIADGIPTGAIAWKVVNAPFSHTDGPFALPDAPNPNNYEVLDPTVAETFSTSHWANPDECDHVHLHGTFQGHGDPDTACGHGGLVFLIAQ